MPTFSDIHPNTAGISQVLASSFTLNLSGKILGMFSSKPPPVLCAKALLSPVFIRGNTELTYILVGAKRSSPIINNKQEGQHENPQLWMLSVFLCLYRQLFNENPRFSMLSSCLCFLILSPFYFEVDYPILNNLKICRSWNNTYSCTLKWVYVFLWYLTFV